MLTLILIITLAYAASAAAKPHPTHISPARERVVRMLDAGLAGTPMAGSGRALEASGWKWHVHPAFMAAVTGIEAAWGRRACRSNRFNAFGLGSCTASWVPTFRSWAGAFDYYARFLTGRTSVTSGWPAARTPYDFHGYCRTRSGAECPTWPSSVSWNMERLGFGPSVRYGR